MSTLSCGRVDHALSLRLLPNCGQWRRPPRQVGPFDLGTAASAARAKQSQENSLPSRLRHLTRHQDRPSARTQIKPTESLRDNSPASRLLAYPKTPSSAVASPGALLSGPVTSQDVCTRPASPLARNAKGSFRPFEDGRNEPQADRSRHGVTLLQVEAAGIEPAVRST